MIARSHRSRSAIPAEFMNPFGAHRKRAIMENHSPRGRMHRGCTVDAPANCPLRSARKTHTNESKLVPACFLVSRFSQLLSSRLRPAKMMTDVHARLNDGRETTVTTTVIHDHVDLRGAHTPSRLPCVRARIQDECRRSVRIVPRSIDRSRSRNSQKRLRI